MEFNDTAVLVLAVICGMVLIPAFMIAIGLTFALAADAGRGMTHAAVRGSMRWRRYEHRKITGK